MKVNDLKRFDRSEDDDLENFDTSEDDELKNFDTSEDEDVNKRTVWSKHNALKSLTSITFDIFYSAS
jgi:hypothetical protein